MRGFIYSIKSSSGTETYIGSTKQAPHVRFAGHRYDAKRGKSTGIKPLIDKYGVDTLVYEVIEEVDCNNINELRQIEDKWIRKTSNCINTYQACISMTMVEYQQMKYHQRYKKHQCECGGSYTTTNKAEHLRTKRHRNFIGPM